MIITSVQWVCGHMCAFVSLDSPVMFEYQRLLIVLLWMFVWRCDKMFAWVCLCKWNLSHLITLVELKCWFACWSFHVHSDTKYVQLFKCFSIIHAWLDKEWNLTERSVVQCQARTPLYINLPLWLLIFSEAYIKLYSTIISVRLPLNLLKVGRLNLARVIVLPHLQRLLLQIFPNRFLLRLLPGASCSSVPVYERCPFSTLADLVKQISTMDNSIIPKHSFKGHLNWQRFQRWSSSNSCIVVHSRCY